MIHLFLLLLSSTHVLHGSRKKMSRSAGSQDATSNVAIEASALSDVEQIVDNGEQIVGEESDLESLFEDSSSYDEIDNQPQKPPPREKPTPARALRRRCCDHRRRRYGQCKMDTKAKH